MNKPICENCLVLPICNKKEILTRIEQCDILKQAIRANITKLKRTKTITPAKIFLLENYRETTLETTGVIYHDVNTDKYLVDLRIADIKGRGDRNSIIKIIQLDKKEDLKLDRNWSPRILLTGTLTTYIEDLNNEKSRSILR